MTTPAQNEALAAAEEIVQAFGSHDPGRYFSLFEPEATFLFHGSARLLGSRAEYESEWAAWERDGFHVLACASSERRADVIADGVAVFTHRVATRVRDSQGEHELSERETIVLRRADDGHWRGVHEHLSPAPRPALSPAPRST